MSGTKSIHLVLLPLPLDGGKSISMAISPEIETFLGPEMVTSFASAIWAQKSRFSPFPWPLQWICPHQRGEKRYEVYLLRTAQPPNHTVYWVTPTNDVTGKFKSHTCFQSGEVFPSAFFFSWPRS
jgi:hypothetical protein